MIESEAELRDRAASASAAPGIGRRAGEGGRISPTVLSGTAKAIDFLLVTISAISGEIYFFAIGSQSDVFKNYLLIGLGGATIFVMLFQNGGGYSLKLLSSLKYQCRHAAIAWAGTISALLAVAFVFKVSDIYSRGWALSWAALAMGSLLISRFVWRSMIQRWSQQGYLARCVAIVGAGPAAETFIRKLQAVDTENISIVGVFDDRRTRVPPSVVGYRVLGTTDDLVAMARTTRIDEVIIALPGYAVERLGMLLHKLKLLPVDLRISADWMTETFPLKGVSSIGPVALLDVFDRPLKNWSGVLKWIEDKVIGGFLLLLCAPLMTIISVAIRLDSRGSVFFVQDRFGFNNNVIHVLKFRTMYADHQDCSGAQRTVRNDVRVTPVGRALRQLSLDELPQLINVIKGEMSLVGPRPHAIAMKAGDRLYHEAVSDYLHRHRVKPGLTGWAQVHGLRGEIDTIEKAHARVKYDLYYIDNWSIWLDLKTLLLTVKILLSRENAY